MHLASVANHGMPRGSLVRINSGERFVFGSASEHRATRLLGFALVGALFAGSQLAAAQVLVFDRGLPTENLNNAAGASKSNVEWADIETLPETPWLPGDDFTLAGTGSYVVTTIRVWSTDSAGLSLRGGVAGEPINVIADTYTA